MQIVEAAFDLPVVGDQLPVAAPMEDVGDHPTEGEGNAAGDKVRPHSTVGPVEEDVIDVHDVIIYHCLYLVIYLTVWQGQMFYSSSMNERITAEQRMFREELAAEHWAMFRTV